MTILIVPEVKITDEKLIDATVVHLVNRLLNKDFKSMNQLQRLSAQFGGVKKAGEQPADEDSDDKKSSMIDMILTTMMDLANRLTNNKWGELIKWANTPSEPYESGSLQYFPVFITKIVKYKINKLFVRFDMMNKKYSTIYAPKTKTTLLSAIATSVAHSGLRGAVLGNFAYYVSRDNTTRGENIIDGIKHIIKDDFDFRNITAVVEKMYKDDVVLRSLVNFCYACKRCNIRNILIDKPENSKITNEALNKQVDDHIKQYEKTVVKEYMSIITELNLVKILGLDTNFTVESLKNSGDLQSLFEIISTLLPIITESIGNDEYINMVGATPYITWDGFKNLIMNTPGCKKMEYYADHGKNDFQLEDGTEDYTPPDRPQMRGVLFKSQNIEGGKLKLQFYYFIKSILQMIFSFVDVCVLSGSITYIIEGILGTFTDVSPLKIAGFTLDHVQKKYYALFTAGVDMFSDNIPKFLRQTYRLKRQPGGKFFNDIIGWLTFVGSGISSMKEGGLFSLYSINMDMTQFVQTFTSSIGDLLSFFSLTCMAYKTMKGIENVVWDIHFGTKFAREMGGYYAKLSTYIQNVTVDTTTGKIHIQPDNIWEEEQILSRNTYHLENTRVSRDELESSIESLKNKTEKITNKITVLGLDLTRKVKNVTTLTSKLTEYKDTLVLAQGNAIEAVKQMEIAKIQESNDNMAGNASILNTVKSFIRGSSPAVKKAEADVNTAQVAVKQAEADVKKAEADVKTAKSDRDAMQTKNDALIAERYKIDTNIKNKNQELKTVQRNLDRLTLAKTTKEENLKKLKDQLPRTDVGETTQPSDEEGGGSKEGDETPQPSDEEGGSSKEGDETTQPLDEEGNKHGSVIAEILYGKVQPKVDTQLKKFKAYIYPKLADFLKKCTAFTKIILYIRKKLYCTCMKILMNGLSMLPIIGGTVSDIHSISNVFIALLKFSSGFTKRIHNITEIKRILKINHYIEYIKDNTGCVYDRLMMFIESKIDDDRTIKGRQDKFIDASVEYVFTFNDKDRDTLLKDGISIVNHLFPWYVKYLLATGVASASCGILAIAYNAIDLNLLKNIGYAVAAVMAVAVTAAAVPYVLPPIQQLAQVVAPYGDLQKIAKSTVQVAKTTVQVAKTTGKTTGKIAGKIGKTTEKLAQVVAPYEDIQKIAESTVQGAKTIGKKTVEYSKSRQPNPMLFPGQTGGAYELAIRAEDMKYLETSMINLHKTNIITFTGKTTKVELNIMELVNILQLPVNDAIINILENADNRKIQDVIGDLIIAGSVGSSNISYKRFDTDPGIETLNGGGLYKTIIDPNTHAKYSTSSKEGMRLLKKLSRVIMNTVIVDPHTGKSVCVYSKEGMNILESYMTNM